MIRNEINAHNFETDRMLRESQVADIKSLANLVLSRQRNWDEFYRAFQTISPDAKYELYASMWGD